MISTEWLIKVDKRILEGEEKIIETIKALNGGYVKIIKEGKKKITISLPKNPSTIELNIKRKRVKDDHSCYEIWEI